MEALIEEDFKHFQDFYKWLETVVTVKIDTLGVKDGKYWVKYLPSKSGNPKEALPIDFIKWYSGMEKEKILKAYERWKNESGDLH